MPDPGRFSNPYGATLPVGVNQPPVRAQDVETLMAWLNQEAASHGWPPFTWQRHNGSTLENFTPQGAPPFGLSGKPWHVKQVWNQIRTAIGSIGPFLFQDYNTNAPYNLNGNGSPHAWQPTDPSTIGQHGKMDLTQAANLINSVPGSAPEWTWCLASRSGSGTFTGGPSIQYADGPINGSGTNGLLPSGSGSYPSLNLVAADASFIEPAASAAFSDLQSAAWTLNFSQPGFLFGQTASYELALGSLTLTGSGAFPFHFPFQGTYSPVVSTVEYSVEVALAFRFIGSGTLKNSVGMVPLSDGTLPFAFGGTLSTGFPSYNPWRYSINLACGTAFVPWPDDTNASLTAVANSILPQLANPSVAINVPIPTGTATDPTTRGLAWSDVVYSTFYALNNNTLATQPIGDFSAAQQIQGGNVFWVALASSNPWTSGNPPALPTLPWPSPGGFGSGGVSQMSEGLGLTVLNSTPTANGYWIGNTNGGLFIQAQSSGALGVLLPFASGS